MRLSRGIRPRILGVPHSFLEERNVVQPRRLKFALLMAVTVLACSQALFAHAILMESTPKANTTVNGSEVNISLRYNVRIDGSRSRIQLLNPDGTATPLTLDKQPTPDVLQCKATGLKPGAYKIKWNVLASDGHMSKGEVPFTVQ